MSSLVSQPPKLRTASPSLYRRDGYTWAKQQAEALRRRDLEQIDWENVIEEIESVGRAEKSRWVSQCARAIEHMLAIEHWEHATVGEVWQWRKEIQAFRRGMASAVRANPSLKGEYVEMLSQAWADGRSEAVDLLAEYSAAAASSADQRPYERTIDATLPDDCPYVVEDVAAFDPKRDKQPRSDVWPPSVASVLNAALGTDYETRRSSRRKSVGRAEHRW